MSDVKGKLREAFLSHKVSDGEWLIPPAGDAVLKMLRKQGFDGSALEAMKAYAAAKQLPSRKTRIGYISMIQAHSKSAFEKRSMLDGKAMGVWSATARSTGV